ncbi:MULTISPECIES: hypothetical protein [Hyphomonas]|uniref:hypothetical protein n=1 Tax=Hyphomonas TaxID=85 RepID=UPI0012EB3F09|nr:MULTISPECIES: hypothetical protein [Hyphomonas]
MTQGPDKMTPLWDIQGWSRDGLISHALKEAHIVSPEDACSNSLQRLIHEIRQQEE